MQDIIQQFRLEFESGMAGFTPKIQKFCQKKSREWETFALKNSQFGENFCFYEIIFLKNICVTLGNFLIIGVISYCRSEVIIFQFYQEMKAVQSENSELSHGISCILLVFNKVIVYLHIILDIKSIIGEKIHIPAISHENNSIFTEKKEKKKKLILKLSVARKHEFY